MMSIASWNCQGNPLEASLSLSFLQRLLSEHDVVVLQSCGMLVEESLGALSSITIGRMRCHVRGVYRPTHDDPFCATAILSRLGSDWPLEDGQAIGFGSAGRFGVLCTVLLRLGDLSIAALHAAPSGMVHAELEQALAALPAPRGRRLVSVELGGRDTIDGGLVDLRSVVHRSPGGRLDSFLGIGMRSAAMASGGVIDSAGASDHDAVHAVFET